MRLTDLTPGTGVYVKSREELEALIWCTTPGDQAPNYDLFKSELNALDDLPTIDGFIIYLGPEYAGESITVYTAPNGTHRSELKGRKVVNATDIEEVRDRLLSIEANDPSIKQEDLVKFEYLEEVEVSQDEDFRQVDIAFFGCYVPGDPKSVVFYPYREGGYKVATAYVRKKDEAKNRGLKAILGMAEAHDIKLEDIIKAFENAKR
jgi:hypothetical protein